MEFSAESPADHLIQYPEALYTAILHHAGHRTLAWDVQTGHGKVAFRLSEHFAEVYATESRARLLADIRPHPNIIFEHSDGTHSSLAPRTVDLVTIGQGLHQLPLQDFYAEVQRVARPGSMIAAWGFTIPRVGMEIDRLMNRLYRETLAPYWAPAWQHQLHRYERIPFPFKNVRNMKLDHDYYWELDDWITFLESWTAVRAFQQAHGTSPLSVLVPLFEQHWGKSGMRKVTFTFFIKLGLIL